MIQQTLQQLGVVNIDLVTEEEYPRNVKAELIKECRYWEEVVEICEQNKKTHPTDKIWIRNPHGLFRVLREVA